VSDWKPQEKDYVAAREYRRLHAEEPIRTQGEQASDPYPENVLTACYFGITEEVSGNMDTNVEWPTDKLNYLRPCDVKERYKEDEEGGRTSATPT
jgi:hypothetical protein